MRILIDLQGAQSNDSAHRGVGRYTLNFTRSLIALKRNDWEFHLLLNGSFNDSTAELAWEFGSELGLERVHVFWSVEASRSNDETGRLRRLVSREIRKTAIESVNPDVVLLTSLFEGYSDDAVVGVDRPRQRPIMAGIVYDIIPFLYPKLYLQSDTVRNWYYGIVRQVRELDVALAISETTRKDLITHVGLPPTSVVTIDGAACMAADDGTDDGGTGPDSMAKYQLSAQYVLYTGGNEQRKNIPFLIKSFFLAADIPSSMGLVIVCKIDEVSIERLLIEAGFTSQPEQLIFTNYISERDMKHLLRNCTLFVFPSWYEGLGLPILEAAVCGAPVIASASSSMAEILTMPEATFDPYDVTDCAKKITQGIIDHEFRARLFANSERIAAHYSWERTALEASVAIQRAFDARAVETTTVAERVRTWPVVANVTPLSPTQSGIALYAHDAVPAMSAFGKVVTFTEQSEISDVEVMLASETASSSDLQLRSDEFDLIVYHIGNSHYHWEDLKRLQHTPGLVVLHDPFLSGAVADACNKAGDAFSLFRAYDAAHGLELAVAQATQSSENRAALSKLLLSFWAVGPATSVLVHSIFAKNLLTSQYGSEIGKKVDVINFPMRLPQSTNKLACKRLIGAFPDEIVICSFGFIAPIKACDDIVDAWIRACRKLALPVRLVFVGKPANEFFSYQLQERAKRAGLGDLLLITGFAEQDIYERYLGAADIAVQLRRSARGESSMTIAECLAHGIPTIVNENGSLSEISSDAVYMLSDHFDASELTDALLRLIQNTAYRLELSDRARQYAEKHFDANLYAQRLMAMAHQQQNSSAYWRSVAIKRISKIKHTGLNAFDQKVLYDPIALTFPPESSKPRIFFDVSGRHPGNKQSRDEKSSLKRAFSSARSFAEDEKLIDMIDLSHEKFSVDTRAIDDFMEVRLPFGGEIPRVLTSQDVLVLGFHSVFHATNLPWLLRFCSTGGRAVIFVTADEIAIREGEHRHFKILIEFAIRHHIPLVTNSECVPTIQDMLDQHIDIRAELKAVIFDDPKLPSQFGKFLVQGQFQNARHIFELARRRFFPASDKRLQVGVGRRIGHMIAAVGDEGHLLYGPYIRLLPGIYDVKITLLIEQVGYIRLEIVGNNRAGDQALSQSKVLMGCERGSHTMVEQIDAPGPLEEVEIRLFVSAQSRLAVLSVAFIEIT